MGGNSSSYVKKGDKVLIEIEDDEVINELQKNHGGVTSLVKELMTTPGVIESQTSGTSTVKCSSGTIQRVNTSLLRKYSDSVIRKHQLMFSAVDEGDLATVGNLVNSFGPNVVMSNKFCLILAISKGHLDVVKLLVDNGVEINFIDNEGNTALHWAVREKKSEICQILVDKGADVNIKNNDGMTPMILSVNLKLSDICAVLADKSEANLNIGDDDDKTALHLAVETSQIDIVNSLIIKGADITAFDKERVTPFHLAVKIGNPRILKMFLERGWMAIIDLQNKDKLTALQIAVIENHVDCLKLLIQYNPDKNVRNNDLQSPLHMAVRQTSLESAKILVDAGAELNIQDKNGNTPLHEAVIKHAITYLQHIVSSELNRNRQSYLGDLMIKEDIVLYLVEKGALLQIENKVGESPNSLLVRELKLKILSKQNSQNNVISGTDSESTVTRFFSDREFAESNGVTSLNETESGDQS